MKGLHLPEVSQLGPTRTCVGCKQRAQQADLLRVVAVGSDLVPDGPVRQPGRGAYLHPRPECLQLAIQRRAFPRSLRISGPLSTEAVAALLQGQ